MAKSASGVEHRLDCRATAAGSPAALLMFSVISDVSGTALSDTATYDNVTFATLGVTPGTFKWTWGTGANQTFTLQIGPAAVPETGSTLRLLLFGLLGLLGATGVFALRLA